MSSENGSNAVLTIAVVVLGYVMYTRLAQAKTQVVTTGATNGPSKALQTAQVGASLANSLASLFRGASGGTSGNAAEAPLSWLPASGAGFTYNPDEISSDISSDALSALGGQGMDLSNAWGFSL
jgi:hypothetical protein